MIAKTVTVVKTKQSAFTNDEGKSVSFFQICAEDDDRLYLLSSGRNLEVGTTIDIAYDATRKRYSIIEFT